MMSELEKVNVSDIERLAKLREPFPVHQISKLPKPTKAQNDCPPSEKINCSVCGGWHHPRVIHLDYVGHAALTDRLLDVDPLWHWEPMTLKDGLPAFDETGGLWIRLFVLGHSRIGYGHAAHSTYKEIGSREKEVIGDALRNAAMRFGAALELWHKGQLHAEEPSKLDEDAQDIMILFSQKQYWLAVEKYAEVMSSLDVDSQAMFKGLFNDSKVSHVLSMGNNMMNAKTLDDLQGYWLSVRDYAKKPLEGIKDKCKVMLSVP